MASNSVFRKINLKNANHQIPISEEDAAFEACGRPFYFNRIPFGVTKGVACFQRVIDKIIQDEKLIGVYAYLAIIVCGQVKPENES